MVKFLTEEGCSPIEMYRHFRNVYDEDAVDVGLDTGSIKSSEEDIGYRPHIGRPAMAVTSETMNKSCQWNSWREVPRSVPSVTCRHERS
jgi:hypothetical protein